MRLIDGDILENNLAREYVRTAGYKTRDTLNKAIIVVKNMPTVDAVEVVRCKDCKYFDYEQGALHGDCDLLNAEHTFPPEGYCAYGEKKEGAD